MTQIAICAAFGLMLGWSAVIALPADPLPSCWQVERMTESERAVVMRRLLEDVPLEDVATALAEFVRPCVQ